MTAPAGPWQTDMSPAAPPSWPPARPAAVDRQDRQRSTGRWPTAAPAATDNWTDSDTGSWTDRTDSDTDRQHQQHRQPTPAGRIVVAPARLPDDPRGGGLNVELPDDEDWEHPGPPLGAFRFARESPGSLLDQQLYARDAAYSIRSDGLWRQLNIVFARFWANPGLAVCYFIGWAYFTRLSRTATAIPVTICVLWALNQLPIIGWLIPDGLDFTSYFPEAGIGE